MSLPDIAVRRLVGDQVEPGCLLDVEQAIESGQPQLVQDRSMPCSMMCSPTPRSRSWEPPPAGTYMAAHRQTRPLTVARTQDATRFTLVRRASLEAAVGGGVVALPVGVFRAPDLLRRILNVQGAREADPTLTRWGKP